MLKQVKKILAKSEQTGSNSMNLPFTEEMFFDENISSKIEASDLTVLGDEKVKTSPLTKAVYREEKTGEICRVCNSCEIGKETLGIKMLK